MSELVIAAVAAPFGRDMEACLRRIERVLGEARVCGARLVVLPEAVLGGYVEPLDDDDDVPAPPALDPAGPELRRVAELAGDLTVCVGFAEDAGDGIVHNVAACVSGDGLLGLHRKVHLPLAPGGTTTPGDELAAFDTPVGRIGMLVSHDKAFPEAARTLALDGAEIVVAPAAWPVCRKGASRLIARDRQTRYFNLVDRARAVENQLVWVSTNQTGDWGGLRFPGYAKVVSPRGDVLARTRGRERMALAHVDPRAALDDARARICHLDHRRPETYGAPFSSPPPGLGLTSTG
jgi:predicted amidohydrolase